MHSSTVSTRNMRANNCAPPSAHSACAPFSAFKIFFERYLIIGYTNVGVQLLTRICWGANVGAQLLARICWGANVGVHLSGAQKSGAQVSVRICKSAKVPHPSRGGGAIISGRGNYRAQMSERKNRVCKCRCTYVRAQKSPSHPTRGQKSEYYHPILDTFPNL